MAVTKFRHIIFAPVNGFLKRPGSGPAYLAPMGDFEKIMEEGGSLGASKLQDFTWKQLFDADTCVRCGRCTERLPRGPRASRFRRWPSSRTSRPT